MQRCRCAVVNVDVKMSSDIHYGYYGFILDKYGFNLVNLVKLLKFYPKVWLLIT